MSERAGDIAALRRAHRHRLRRERFVLPVTVTLLLLAIVFPFLWLLVLSVKPMEAMFAWPPQLFFTPTIGHCVGLWDGDFPKSFVKSLATSVGSTLAAMVLGVPGAYALSRMRAGSSGPVSLAISPAGWRRRSPSRSPVSRPTAPQGCTTRATGSS